MRILHVGDDFAALRPCGLTLYSDALMRAQAEAGHEVSYVFSGRHYPRLRQPRLKRWRHGDVRMIELVGPPLHNHWDRGTLMPAAELAEPAGEAAFETALREARPDVVHIQELGRLPSSLIERAKAHGLPVVMSLNDYRPVCASVRLFDADERRCTRLELGEDCARNCAGADPGPGPQIGLTIDYELARLQRAAGLRPRVRYRHVASASAAVGRLTGAPAPEPAAPPRPSDYQLRRDVNVRRLSMCDALVAPSARVAEVYASLGVEPDRMRVQRITLPHLETLWPGRGPEVGSPLRFVTLQGAAAPAKGARVLLAALRALEGREFRLRVSGGLHPDVADEFRAHPSVELVTVDPAGPYSDADRDRILDDADVGLMPSVWEEAHGFVGIEMLAKGIPLIANAVGGIPEYVRDGETGWLNHDLSGAGLAALMAAAIDRPGEVERMRRSVRERRAELVRPHADHIAEMEALYAGLIGDQAAAMASPAARRSAS